MREDGQVWNDVREGVSASLHLFPPRCEITNIKIGM